MPTATANGLGPDAPVPVDAVTASGSGLDPHISVANARLQAGRVADARGPRPRGGARARRRHTASRSLGFLGEAGCQRAELNLASTERPGRLIVAGARS